jgi:YD repeat-containing protein
MEKESTELFLRLWDGYEQRHIELDGTNRTKEDSGKVKVKTVTVEGLITSDLVWAHLNGKASIGVAPVKADSTCRFGVLDIDWYDMPEDDVMRVRDRLRTVCAGFRSKSRGLHVYVFTSEPVPAQIMHDYLVTLRKRLPKDIQKKTEIFPKETQTRIGPNDEPTAVNLPLKDTQREMVFLIDRGGQHAFQYDDQSPLVAMRHIDAHCRVDAAALTEIVGETPSMDGSDIGYRVPKDPKGRNDLLMRIAMSMQARGWSDKEMDLEINRLNKDGQKSDDDIISSVMTSPLDQGEINNLLKQAKKKEKGAAALIHYRQIEKFNDRWSKITIHGQVEYVDKHAPEFTTFKKEALFDETSDQTVRMGKAVVPLAKVWMQDIDHARFKEVVCEPADYIGPGYNIWKGFAVVPKAGDPAIFIDYIENVLCNGDAALARWLTMWLADACQRPTEPSPPTAVAMRGPQGAGKTFLQEHVLTRIFGKRHVYKVQQASRMFGQFNRSMFGATFIAAEESIFHGSAATASTLKDFISSPSWVYEEKFKAAFPQKNVHRLIATTNEDQAVHIDFDDRRWTVIEVPQRFDMLSEEGKAQAYEFWEPYHAFIKADDGPGIVLRYLLDFPVDRRVLTFGHITQAKTRDKIASDPVLAALDDIAAKGFCPDDEHATGVVSSPTFCRMVKEQGANNMSPKAVMMRLDKLIPCAKPVTNARVLRGWGRSVGDNGMSVYADIEGGQRGRYLGALDEFRRVVARLTGEAYDDGKVGWHAWNSQLSAPTSDPDEELPY